MAEVVPKFVKGAIISRLLNAQFGLCDAPRVQIEEVIIRSNLKTSVYVIGQKTFPIRYIDKYYKTTLSSTLKLL